MRTKPQYRYKLLSELRIERFLVLVIGMFISFLIMRFYLEPDEQQKSLYRIEHMVKACMPNSADQVTTMRLIKRDGHHELQCEKQSISLTHPLQPSAAIRREI